MGFDREVPQQLDLSGHTFRDRVNLRPLSLSVRSITVKS
jgi:hypothetical protein